MPMSLYSERVWVSLVYYCDLQGYFGVVCGPCSERQNKRQQGEHTRYPVSHSQREPDKLSWPSSWLSISSFVPSIYYKGMQAVVHRQPLPLLLDQYHLPSLAQPRSNHPTMMPTPPVLSRKRKRPHQFTVSYSEVQEVDSEGRIREVIVIEDTPPPSTISPATTHTNAYSASYQPPPYSAPIRTRARAAAEAQAMSATTSSAVLVPPVQKKRKRDQADESRGTLVKKVATGLQQQPAVPSTKSWASGSGPVTTDVRNSFLALLLVRNRALILLQPPNVPCDDKEGHYIIVPDDLIYNRCKSPLLCIALPFRPLLPCRSHRSPPRSRDLW